MKILIKRLKEYINFLEEEIKRFSELSIVKPYLQSSQQTIKEGMQLRKKIKDIESVKSPKVIVLCGSSKYVAIMSVCAWLLERDEGAITMSLHLLPQWYAVEDISDHLAEHEGVSEQMDELHLRKIDLADEIFVVNCNGYVGLSTRKEINYAMKKRLPIRWYISHAGVFDPIAGKVIKLIDKYTEHMKSLNP
jgi:hypothetical protein